MHILQNGMPRSGNVWLHYLLRDLLQTSGIPVAQNIASHPVGHALAAETLPVREAASADFMEITPLGSFFTILDAFRWPIKDLAHYVAHTSLVATHSAWCERSANVYRQFSHRIYIIRDPRDAALSLARFECQPGNRLHRPHPFPDPASFLRARFEAYLHGWVQHVSDHLDGRRDHDIHILFYERLMTRPRTELKRLAHHLGLRVPPSALSQICERNDLETMQTRQPEHTDRGGWGRWRASLSPLQIRSARSIAGPLLDHLGYPLSPEAATDWTPMHFGESDHNPTTQLNPHPNPTT